MSAGQKRSRSDDGPPLDERKELLSALTKDLYQACKEADLPKLQQAFEKLRKLESEKAIIDRIISQRKSWNGKGLIHVALNLSMPSDRKGDRQELIEWMLEDGQIKYFCSEIFSYDGSFNSPIGQIILTIAEKERQGAKEEAAVYCAFLKNILQKAKQAIEEFPENIVNSISKVSHNRFNEVIEKYFELPDTAKEHSRDILAAILYKTIAIAPIDRKSTVLQCSLEEPISSILKEYGCLSDVISIIKSVGDINQLRDPTAPLPSSDSSFSDWAARARAGEKAARAQSFASSAAGAGVSGSGAVLGQYADSEAFSDGERRPSATAITWGNPLQSQSQAPLDNTSSFFTQVQEETSVATNNTSTLPLAMAICEAWQRGGFGVDPYAFRVAFFGKPEDPFR